MIETNNDDDDNANGDDNDNGNRDDKDDGIDARKVRLFDVNARCEIMKGTKSAEGATHEPAKQDRAVYHSIKQ